MDIRKSFYKIYWKIQKVIVPGLKYSQDIYEEVIKTYVKPNVEWLDLGCGHRILPPWRGKEERMLIGNCKNIVGIDYDLHSLKKNNSIHGKVRGNITELPFKNNSFDLITSNMVIEHLDNPDVQFAEINRVLKIGGIFVFHTPNKYGYAVILKQFVPNILVEKLVFLLEGRKEDDVFETHYKANSRRKIDNLVKNNGFDIIKVKYLVTSAQFIIFPPLVILELIWIRILMLNICKQLRTNIIAILRKLD